MNIFKKMDIAGTTILLSMLLTSVGHPAEPNPSPELTGVAASLVYDEDGTIDDRDLTSEKLALWNTPIGEGDAGRPSSSTFAIVRVKRPVTMSARSGELVVTLHAWAQASGRLIFHERAVAPPFIKERATVPFLIRGTGCEPLRVEAAIEGRREPVIRRTINFKCGS